MLQSSNVKCCHTADDTLCISFKTCGRTILCLIHEMTFTMCSCYILATLTKPIRRTNKNKANLRDLIAATGLVILLKLDANRRFFRPCDLEIWWMTPTNNKVPLLYYIKFCVSFKMHWWIQTGVTVRKDSVRVKIDDFLSHVTLKFDGWPWKTIGHLFNATASFLHHFIAIDEFKLKLQSGNAKFGSNSTIFRVM